MGSAGGWVSRSALLLATVGWFWPLAAQVAAPSKLEPLVAFHVRNKGRQVEGLTADDIVFKEDDEPQKVSFFWSAAAETPAPNAPPVELILIFDTSQRGRTGVSQPSRYAGPGLDAVLRKLPNVRLAIYGYDQSLTRYCRPTHDRDSLVWALRQTQSKLRVSDVKPVKIPLDPPLEAPADKRETLDWNDVLIQAAWDAARQSGEAVRLVVAFLDGLPGAGWDPPELVLRQYQAMGIALYPGIRWHFWVKEFIDASGVKMHDDPELKRGGLQWNKMTFGERLDWAKDEEPRIAAYEGLGEGTGGWSFDGRTPLSDVLVQVAWELGGLYVAGYRPNPSPDPPAPHRLEIRLKDPAKGQLAGGTRAARD